jgi:adenosine kinase
MPIFKDLWDAPGRVIVTGGAALNAARCAAFTLSQQGAAKTGESFVDYFGAIGKDDRGAELAKIVADGAVTGNYHVAQDKDTGICACIVDAKKERTLTTDLAAACAYQESHLEANKTVLEKAKFIYTTGFFITSSMPSLLNVANYANSNDVPMGFNLSAVFLQFIEKDNVMKAIEHSDFVFGNEDEGAQFAKTAEMAEGATLQDVAKKIASMKKTNQNRPRVCIITYGPKPCIIATCQPGGEAELFEVEVPALTQDQITDTNGCGDSFVGAFLASYLQDKELKECVKDGITLSTSIIQQVGCTLPEKCAF